MVRIEPELTRSTADESYWLGHCEGFRVESPRGRVGTVESVVLGAGNRPAQLSVCTGVLRLRTVLIPIDDVAVVEPRDLRLRVRHAPRAKGARSGSVAARRILHPLGG